MTTLLAPRQAKRVHLAAPQKKRWTVNEFYHLAEQGWFDHGRAMLLDGEIIEMPIPNPPHAMSVTLSDDVLRSAFGPGFVIRIQQPLPLNLWTDPIPDLSVAPGSPRDYNVHPTTALLAMEVSDSSLAIDLAEKSFLYAAGGIADYWVLDLNNRRLIVFRDPAADPTSPSGFRYQTRLDLDSLATVSPLAAPQTVIRVADLLP